MTWGEFFSVLIAGGLITAVVQIILHRLFKKAHPSFPWVIR